MPYFASRQSLVTYCEIGHTAVHYRAEQSNKLLYTTRTVDFIPAGKRYKIMTLQAPADGGHHIKREAVSRERSRVWQLKESRTMVSFGKESIMYVYFHCHRKGLLLPIRPFRFDGESFYTIKAGRLPITYMSGWLESIQRTLSQQRCCFFEVLDKVLCLLVS